jgi:soluble P-type ATPase
MSYIGNMTMTDLLMLKAANSEIMMIGRGEKREKRRREEGESKSMKHHRQLRQLYFKPSSFSSLSC